MDDTVYSIRKDLEFFPIDHNGQRFILINDKLGLVQEGKAISLPLYQIMTLLDGSNTMRDLQLELIRQRGGMLVGEDEVRSLLHELDESFLLNSERFRIARDKLVFEFSSKKTRPCSHCGTAYPKDPTLLKSKLDEIISSQSALPKPEGKTIALICPHIDLSVGHKVYSSAYQMLQYTRPSRVVLLGVGHQMIDDLFSLTDKDFETPLGRVKSETTLIHVLQEAGEDIIAADDFIHRSEHSIEFQIIFLQHLLEKDSFTIIPILCGFIQSNLSDFNRDSYREMAGPFLQELSNILIDTDAETLLIAGVDFSHIGPKFGHRMPAVHLEKQSETHDKSLLESLSKIDADQFWEESIKAKDQFNVCGFAALACMLEVLPQCKGKVFDYQIWHEEASRSAVSFSSVVFTS
ncbi:MAG: AmmeMemoRadiSam system protein B [Thermodesulfobacteriota bacterium]|nr:AmmeMemoRadiSam system protein B [Thermodesulfobacteriota bacterium]